MNYLPVEHRTNPLDGDYCNTKRKCASIKLLLITGPALRVNNDWLDLPLCVYT